MASLPILFFFLMLLSGSSSQGRNCKTFYFQAKIYVKDIAHCSNWERRRLGAFLNRVINDAFANINIVTLNAKVCSTPQSSYRDDDGYYDDDNSTRRILEDEDVFLESNNHTTMIQPNQEDPAAEQRWLRFGTFFYIGGGSCRFCLRDNWDNRRARRRILASSVSSRASSSNGYSSAGAWARPGGNARAYAHSNRGVGGSGTGGYGTTSSIANKNGHVFSFMTSLAWTKSLERKLEESLSNYLTRVVKQRYRRGCLRRRTPKVSVDLTRTRRRNARPRCSR